MVYYIAADLGDSIYAVLGDFGEAVELDKSGVYLLDMFADVIGCNPNQIEVSVFSQADMVLDINADYVLEEALGKGKYERMDADVDDMLARGYLVPIYGQEFINYNPSLAMRYGIKACVTDKGRLLKLYSEGKEELVLGDFCTSLNEACIMYPENTVFIFDDRITYVPFEFYRPMSRVNPIKCDTSAVKNLPVRAELDSLIATGYIKEMSYRRRRT